MDWRCAVSVAGNALLGAFAGSAVPGLGTVVGMIVGGAAGAGVGAAAACGDKS